MNKFSIYGYIANEQKVHVDNRYKDVVKQLETTYDFKTAYDTINHLVGYVIDGIKKFDGPDNYNLGVIKDNDRLEIMAWHNGEQVFGRGWRIPKEDNQ